MMFYLPVLLLLFSGCSHERGRIPSSDEAPKIVTVDTHKKSKFNSQRPVKERTVFTVVSKGDHTLVMRLKLADKNNKPITLHELPEILVDGEALVEDIKLVKKGVWEFTLKYPESNVIVYLSVRCQDVFFEHIYRFQHVEK